jgi:hypothetical protein
MDASSANIYKTLLISNSPILQSSSYTFQSGFFHILAGRYPQWHLCQQGLKKQTQKPDEKLHESVASNYEGINVQ